MAAKIVLAAFAVLCAFAATNAAVPVMHPLLATADGRFDLDLEVIHLERAQRVWINVTEILDDIEELLGTVQRKIEDASDEVESAVSAVLERIEDAALNVASKWNSTVQQWVDKANAAGIDIKECLEEEKTLAEVLDGLRADAKECVDDRLQQLQEALHNVQQVGVEAKDLLDEVKEIDQACSEKGNVIAVGLCYVARLPAVKVKAVGLVAKAVYLSSVVAVRTAAIVPLTSLCTARATVGRTAEVTRIVNKTVKCIRGKLSPGN